MSQQEPQHPNHDSVPIEKLPMLGIRWLTVALYTVVITVLALVPNGALKAITIWDKLNHFAAYSVFVLLLAYCFLKMKAFGYGLLVLVCYGISIEFIQSFVGRESSALDMLANILGILCGCLLLKLFQLSPIASSLKPPLFRQAGSLIKI